MKEGEEKKKRKKSTTMEEEIPTKAQRGEEGEQKSRRNRVNEVEWNVSELNMIYPMCMKWSKEVGRRLNFAAIPPQVAETFYDQRDCDEESDTLTEHNQWTIWKLKTSLSELKGKFIALSVLDLMTQHKKSFYYDDDLVNFSKFNVRFTGVLCFLNNFSILISHSSFLLLLLFPIKLQILFLTQFL